MSKRKGITGRAQKAKTRNKRKYARKMEMLSTRKKDAREDLDKMKGKPARRLKRILEKFAR